MNEIRKIILGVMWFLASGFRPLLIMGSIFYVLVGEYEIANSNMLVFILVTWFINLIEKELDWSEDND